MRTTELEYDYQGDKINDKKGDFAIAGVALQWQLEKNAALSQFSSGFPSETKTLHPLLVDISATNE